MKIYTENASLIINNEKKTEPHHHIHQDCDSAMARSDGRSINTYRHWKVSISIDTFFWYRYLLIDTLVLRFT